MGAKQEDVHGLPDEVSTAQRFELIVVDLDSLSAVALMKTTMMRMIVLSPYPRPCHKQKIAVAEQPIDLEFTSDRPSIRGTWIILKVFDCRRRKQTYIGLIP